MTSHDWFKKHADRLERSVAEWPKWLRDASESTPIKKQALNKARDNKGKKE